MNTALTVWNGRVAPVCDSASRILVWKTPDEIINTLDIPSISLEEKVRFFTDHNISTLICGAVSSEFEQLLAEKNIEVISFTAGCVEKVMQAWKENTLVHASFSMPGCGCPRRRCGRGREAGCGRTEGRGWSAGCSRETGSTRDPRNGSSRKNKNGRKRHLITL